MSVLEIILLALCVVLVAVFIVLRVCRGGIVGLILKTVASFGFVSSSIIGLVVSGASGFEMWSIGLISIGLLCGMVGDIVLDLKVIYKGNDNYYLNAGMSSFFIGHIFYIVAFSLLINVENKNLSYLITDFGCLAPLLISIICAIAITLFIVLSSKKMGLNFGKFKLQTIAYTFILSMSMVYTVALSVMGAGLWLAFVGMLLFFLSDVVLSFQYFGGKLDNKTLIIVNHSLYYIAQIILVAFVFVL